MILIICACNMFNAETGIMQTLYYAKVILLFLNECYSVFGASDDRSYLEGATHGISQFRAYGR